MKVLILNGNPETESLTRALCESYALGVTEGGNEPVVMHIADMQFDPILHEGHHGTQPLEPALISFQKELLACHLFVVAYPTWWGGLPAILKGLFDRALFAGFAYKYHDKDPMWDKLLTGRRGHIITTMDAPLIWYQFAYGSSGNRMLKDAIMKFCGIHPVKETYFTRVRFKTKEEILHDLKRVRELGRRAGK